ncbi:MAG: AsnC family transcriptional regulator [Candidatus Bathyarchaeota archaeon]|nr:AsnC family transcriptional regulator [Candidatus Bathyarchaeota archaeon]
MAQTLSTTLITTPDNVDELLDICEARDFEMRKQLDSLDIKILEALGVYGPRNISKLAERIKVPTPTVRDRIKALKSHFSLLLQVSVYHTSIGLKKAFVFAKAAPGREQLLWESMKANGYWLYLTARYDAPESFYGIYGIPKDHTEQFKQFVERIEKLGIAQSINLYWSTCIQTLNLTDNWYDHESGRWAFKWDKWIKDIPSQGTSLPNTLVESESYPQKADRIDVIVLKELQKNAECELCDIAKLLAVSPQTVQYHFKNHVIAKGLIEGYVVFLPHFEALSDSYCFRFDFHDKEFMARFALSLKDKPFVRSIGKIFGKNALFVHIYLPREEFRGLTDSLPKLIRNGQLKSYDYSIEDPSRKKAQTIPYEFFKDKSWIYDHRKHMEKLQELASHGLS